MDRGIYLAASGMLAEMARQDAIANNLANATTPGYKADGISVRSFQQILMANRQNGRAVGPIGVGVQASTITNFSQGALQHTREPLDFALEGDGFFAVQTPQGVRYTRNGRFTLGAGNILQDSLGNPVLGRNGQPIRITGDAGQISVSADGTIRRGNAIIGQLGVFALANPTKIGGNLYEGQAQLAVAGEYAVRHGYLETSGTDPVRSLVELIASVRNFEAGQRVLRTIDDTLAVGVRAFSVNQA